MLKKFTKYSILFFLFLSLGVIFFSALVSLYGNKASIMSFIVKNFSYKEQVRKSYNPLDVSTERFLPPLTNEVLKKQQANQHLIGSWSSPFDWPVVSIHLLMLPDGKVMSYGSFSADVKKNQGEQIKKNKEILLSNNKKLNRDAGGVQWKHLEVFHGIDFDIWDPTKGVVADSHHTIKKPIVLDAFCSIARLYDLDTLFILGGNQYSYDANSPYVTSPDATKKTVFYDVKTKKFESGKDLNHARWYGSVVRWNDELVIFGGIHNYKGSSYSVIPEIMKKNDKGEFFWKELPLGESIELFGNVNGDTSWSYPKTYLAPDGNIFGISYNKLWSFNPDSGKPITRTGIIPLEKGMKIQKVEITESNNKDNKKNQNYNNDSHRMVGEERSGLITGTIGASVGNKATSVMLQDKIYMMGGTQLDYVASNHLNRIDISDTFNPKIKRLSPMHSPRSYGNSLILPNGNIFVNGGQYINDNNNPHDQRFANYSSEIYDVQSDTWKELPKASIPRNYHNSSLLLLDGSILVSGGDTWSSEIYYPPYLFEKNNEGTTVFAKKPKISNIKKNYIIGDDIQFTSDSKISGISLISAGSTTHSQGVELKYFDLKFKKKNSDIFAKLPKNRKTLQKGVYILFVLNESGVPSHGQTLMLN